MKKYNISIFFITILLCAAVASINWLVNPFMMFNPPILTGVNYFSTECYYKQLVFKPYQLRTLSPRSVIIGASHAGIAFNPDHLPQPAYNLAIGGASSYINWLLLNEAVSTNNQLENIVLELPFFGFNSDNPDNEPGRDPRFENRLIQNNSTPLLNIDFMSEAINDKLASLLSWESLRASLRMVNKQSDVANHRRGSFIEKYNGQWIQQAQPNTSTWTLFENSWKKFLYDEWFPAPLHRFTFSEDNEPMKHLRQSIRLLYQRNINTHIVIAPLHGSLLVALQQAGLWPAFMQWKQAIVRINEEEALKAEKTPYLIHDYAVINTYSQQALPENYASTIRLQNFNDAAHASPILGDHILSELKKFDELKKTDTEKQLKQSSSGGILLNSATIEQHLQNSTSDINQFSIQHPEFQAAIQKIIKSAPKNIHFPINN